LGENEKASYEENVITPAEFEELEKKEKKSIKLKKVHKKEKPSAAPRPVRHEKATDVEMLVLKTEKMEGKIEAMADYREAVDERFSGINQEIGELRSSVMERDRIIREVQKGFSRIEEMAAGMEPERIARQLAKKDESIEKNQAAIESLAVQVKQLRADMKANSEVLDNIRGIEEISDVVQILKQKMSKIEEDRKFTSRTAGKIETMFSDLSNKLGEFQSYKDKIAFNEETMHEIMKVVDMLETRFDETAKKDDLKKLEGSIEEKLEGVKTGNDDRLYELKKLIDNLLSALKEGGIRGVLESVGKSKLDKMFATRGDLEEIRTKLDMLREATAQTARKKQIEFASERRGEGSDVFGIVGEQPARKIPQAPAREKQESREIPEEALPKGETLPGKGSGKKAKRRIPPAPSRKEASQAGPEKEAGVSPVLAIQGKVGSLINQAEEAIKMGNMDVSKNLYREALSMYNQLNRAESYQEATDIYDRIKRLYSRLRIYS
jgi:hypothetical protein